MKLDIEISLEEARQILEDSLKNQFKSEIGTITIVSYSKPKVTFREDGMFESVECRHRYNG